MESRASQKAAWKRPVQTCPDHPQMFTLLIKFVNDYISLFVTHHSQYLYEFPQLIAGIWEKRFAKELHGFLKRNANSFASRQYFGFYHDPLLVSQFSSYSESALNQLKDYPYLIHWFRGIFSFVVHNIPAESILGTMKYYQQKTPNHSFANLSQTVRNRMTSFDYEQLESFKPIVIVDHLIQKLTAEDLEALEEARISENMRKASRERRRNRGIAEETVHLVAPDSPSFVLQEEMNFYPLCLDHGSVMGSIQQKVTLFLNKRANWNDMMSIMKTNRIL